MWANRRNVVSNMVASLKWMITMTATLLLLFTLTFAKNNIEKNTELNPTTIISLLRDSESIGATSLMAATVTAGEFFQKTNNTQGRIDNIDGTVSDRASERGNTSDNGEGISGAIKSTSLIVTSANLLLDIDRQRATALGGNFAGHNSVNLTRHHDGDVFLTTGITSCNTDTCIGLSSGTAGLMYLGGNKDDAIVGSLTGNNKAHLELFNKHHKYTSTTTKISRPSSGGRVRRIGESCECSCLSYLRTYREDLGICVDDIHECSLSPFVSGSSSEKIPFVFLPLRGQIIYPSREISFPDIRTPVCAVTGAQYLTTNGWSDLRNPIELDYPFRMFRDEGRSFLQWLGEPDLRKKMQGRLIVVHLVCREMALNVNLTKKDHIMSPQNIFSPCVAFRVNGSPVKYIHNVSEVLFQSETTSTLAATSGGMTTKEYIVIGVCSLLLGLIYVASVFLYLHMKKRKNRDRSHTRNSLDDLENDINYPKNDQVTFGVPFNRNGSLYSVNSLGTTNEQRMRDSIGNLKEEMGIIKNNPLLQHFPQLNDQHHHHHHHSGFASDVSNSNSECEMDGPSNGNSGFHDKLKQLQTSVLVHPLLNTTNNSRNISPKNSIQNNSIHNNNNNNDNNNNNNNNKNSNNNNNNNNNNSNSNNDNNITNINNVDDNNPNEMSALPTQDNECLPAENCSIVEDIMSEEKLENFRAMVNGTIRKKLYFNPAYFEPHLLAEPPPAAIEFLQKIREVIAIAKYKMGTKRYQPSLIMIPEEGRVDTTAGVMATTATSSQIQTCNECRDCGSQRCTNGHIKSCGDKRNSIEKWLQSVNETDDESENDERLIPIIVTPTTTKNSSVNTTNCIVHNREDAKSNISNGNGNSNNNNNNVHLQSPRCANTATVNTTIVNTTMNNSNTNVRYTPERQLNAVIRRNSPRKEISPPKEKPPPPPVSTKQVSNETIETINNKLSVINKTNNNEAMRLQHKSFMAYQPFDTNISTISVARHYEAFSALTAAAHIYGFAETGSEIYNNPKFNLHDSPSASMRSRGSSHHSKCSLSRKRLDALDQYAAASTPTSLTSAERQHYDMLRNMKQFSEGNYDSLGRDSNLDIPTPDYDSTMEKKIKDIYNSTHSSVPSVPTPDYSTLSRKSQKNGQPPDSPIYRRKSPQYLIVDYETDSLDRLDTPKRKSSHSSSSPSSDVSSQLSPSLSTALPLEEELEINHSVYDKPDTKKKTILKSESRKQEEMAARIKYDTPFLGSMTIEVEHELPSEIEQSTDSEQFDPDTIDRQQRKQSFCDMNAWQAQKTNSQPILSTIHSSCTYSDYMLKSNSSFRSQSSVRATCEKPLELTADSETRVSFNSLRDLYQTQLNRAKGQHGCKCGGQASLYLTEKLDQLTDQGRLLTLEAKHSRRQRVIEPSKTPSPPPIVEISNEPPNKTTIKISTPKVNRATTPTIRLTDESQQQHNNATSRNGSFRNETQHFKRTPSISSTHITPPSTIERLMNKAQQEKEKQKAARNPPPPPPTSKPPQKSPRQTVTATTTAISLPLSNSNAHYQNHGQFLKQSIQSTTTTTTTTTTKDTTTAITNCVEDETLSNHSVSTEFTRISDTVPNSEVEGSRNNTLSSCVAKLEFGKGDYYEQQSQNNSKKAVENDYGAMFNTKMNGLRTDYTLTRYLNRRKLTDKDDKLDIDYKMEANNKINAKNAIECDLTRADVISISSRSNQSSTRLSDRTKEMYRNAGVPVGIAYPQRSSTATNGNAIAATTNGHPSAPVQTVYRCEIEPVQLTHGMQIAMGLKDRAKKAKDLKNAWKKFVSMAAAKFSPTHSPASSYEKKVSNLIEVIDRDEGISSLIEDHPQVSTPKSSYSAPASQNYYEQRFGPRPQEMDSGYMSADSGEVYKRNFYDRYNFRMRSGRDQIIRIDTIEDNSDGGSTLTDRPNVGVGDSILVDNRFEDFENMGDPPPHEQQQPIIVNVIAADDTSDADSERTITRRRKRIQTNKLNANEVKINNDVNAGNVSVRYSSEDENTTTYGSSETDGETNAEEMWESGAESIETHSVLYKNVRKK